MPEGRKPRDFASLTLGTPTTPNLRTPQWRQASLRPRSQSRGRNNGRSDSRGRGVPSRSQSRGRGDPRSLSLRDRGPSFVIRPSDFSAQEGTNVHMYAKIDGNPPPHVKWSLNYSEIYNKSEFSDSFGDYWLTIREAQKNGTVTCSASNKVAKATTECKLTIDGTFCLDTILKKLFFLLLKFF